jgi:hypothetical protein|nr:MAG TPA_asm: hypothetical protein [Caudoviricetes sp.]
MNVILWVVVGLAGIGLLTAISEVFSKYAPTLGVMLFFDTLKQVLVQILIIGCSATFFAALLIGMLERGGA